MTVTAALVVVWTVGYAVEQCFVEHIGLAVDSWIASAVDVAVVSVAPAVVVVVAVPAAAVWVSVFAVAVAAIDFAAIHDRCTYRRIDRRPKLRALLRPIPPASLRYCPISADWAGHAIQFGDSCEL